MHERHVPLRYWSWFWLTLAIPLLSAIAISTTIILSDNSIGQFCGSSVCWTNFIIFFKIPIATAGLAIPIVGIVAAIHRSEETAIQIKHSQKQFDEVLANNKFGNYLKHRDSFIDLVLAGQERLLDGESKVKINAAALYEKIYPKNDYTHLEIHSNNNFQFWEIMHARLSALLECGRNLDNNNISRQNYASNIIINIKQVLDILEIKLENGWSICGAEYRSSIKCELVRRSDLLSSLSATIELIFSSADMLNTISDAECEIDELHSEFDAAWKKAVYENMYAAFEEA